MPRAFFLVLPLNLVDFVLANLALPRGVWHLVRPGARSHELVRTGALGERGRN